MSTKEASGAVIEGSSGRPVIAVAENAFSDRQRLIDHFDQADLRFIDVSDPGALTESTAGASGLVVTLQPLRQGHIEALAPSVRVIGRAGVGVDTIDLEAAEDAGVTVVNQPSYGTNEVASHAVALLLTLQRRICAQDAFVRNGWSGPLVLAPMRPLDEVVVGVVGCGRIGSATAAMLVPLVGQVVGFDPARPAMPPGVDQVAKLTELLGRCHVVSLHLPLTPDTAQMVDSAFFAAMTPGSLLVNVSRGGLVNEEALVVALQSGHLGGAALDVFQAEPLPADSPLLSAPNTVFSPHTASFSERSGWRLANWTIGDTIEWATSGRVTHGNIVVQGAR